MELYDYMAHEEEVEGKCIKSCGRLQIFPFYDPKEDIR